MKKKSIVVILAAIMISLLSVTALAGCSSGDSNSGDSGGSQASSESAQGDGSSAYIYLARPSTSGALRVAGTQLCDKDWNPVVLHGVSTHGIAWFGQYVNADLFGQLSDGWNANVVRLAMYTAENGGYCEGGDQAALKQQVLDGVEYATKADMYAIVDWHVLSDANPAKYQSQAVEFFGDVSAKLADHDNVIYEICNEPNGSTTWADVKSYAETVIPVIRANDPDAVILVGTPEWCQRPDEAVADKIDADNIMYTLHFYAATHKDDLRQRMQSAFDAGLPIFVSEFGVCDASGNGSIDEDSANTWVSQMDQLGISWCMWSLCNKDESASIISSSCSKTSGLSESDLAPAGAWLKNALAMEPGQASAALAGTAAGATAGVGGSDGISSGSADASSENVSVTGSSGQFSYSITQANSWNESGKLCRQYTMSITNNGSDCTSWSVSVPFSEAIQIKDGWNGVYAVNGNTLVVSNASYNGTIGAGQTINDIGFQIVGSSSAVPE